MGSVGDLAWFSGVQILGSRASGPLFYVATVYNNEAQGSRASQNSLNLQSAAFNVEVIKLSAAFNVEVIKLSAASVQIAV